MNIIIVGLGKLGLTLTKQLVTEGHDITVVDINSQKVSSAVDAYDVMGVCGNGTTCETLETAITSKSKLIIAATASDEVNILCCLIANRMGVENTIARVRNPDYAAQKYQELSVSRLRQILNLSQEARLKLQASEYIRTICSATCPFMKSEKNAKQKCLYVPFSVMKMFISPQVISSSVATMLSA